MNTQHNTERNTADATGHELMTEAVEQERITLLRETEKNVLDAAPTGTQTSDATLSYLPSGTYTPDKPYVDPSNAPPSTASPAIFAVAIMSAAIAITNRILAITESAVSFDQAWLGKPIRPRLNVKGVSADKLDSNRETATFSQVRNALDTISGALGDQQASLAQVRQVCNDYEVAQYTLAVAIKTVSTLWLPTAAAVVVNTKDAEIKARAAAVRARMLNRL